MSVTRRAAASTLTLLRCHGPEPQAYHRKNSVSQDYLIDADSNPLPSDSFNAREQGDGTDGASGQISTGSGPATKNWTRNDWRYARPRHANSDYPHNTMPPYLAVLFLMRTLSILTP